MGYLQSSISCSNSEVKKHEAELMISSQWCPPSSQKNMTLNTKFRKGDRFSESVRPRFNRNIGKEAVGELIETLLLPPNANTDSNTSRMIQST